MIIIDGITYDVPITKMRRSADVLDKYAERTIDGVLHREIIGVYFNYRVEFGTPASMADYVLLWAKLTEPEEFHTVIIPDEDGDLTFSAYISSVNDEIYAVRGTKRYLKNLKANFIARSPARS